MNVNELDYDLPPGLVATHPVEPRDASRLLVFNRATGKLDHRHFRDLPDLLRSGDLLVVNDTRVLPAKLNLYKRTGGHIPGLFLRECKPGQWEVMLRSRGKLAIGEALISRENRAQEGERGKEIDFRLTLLERLNFKGQWLVRVEPAWSAGEILEVIGQVPLPPYIEKARADWHEPMEQTADHNQYQTVYAREKGSVAAPTAGLHFTPQLLERLQCKKIDSAAVTLHVGAGTFLPVQVPTLEEHYMHWEKYMIPIQTVGRIAQQRKSGQRVVAVGTTTVRTLEAAAERISHQPAANIAAETNLLIQPGFQFRLTDALITNFHLPRSTLLALVGAFTGMAQLKSLYAEAIAKGYRFYSYGDAMLIL